MRLNFVTVSINKRVPSYKIIYVLVIGNYLKHTGDMVPNTQSCALPMCAPLLIFFFFYRI
jgi:hypothetical protein